MKNKSVKIRALITTTILSLLFLYNPLGLRTAAEKYNEDLILQLFSPFFAESASKDISVILLNDAFLEQTGTFPVTYSHLARLLKIIGQHKPDAVFFDILQHYKHSNKLEKWLKQIQKSPFPVLLASDPAYDTENRLRDPKSLRHDLFKYADFTAVTWSDNKHYYPLYVDWNQKEMPTAAMALYRLWCNSHLKECKMPPPPVLKGSDYFNEAMIVQWSNKSDKQQQHLFPLKGDCQNTSSNSMSHLFELLKTYLQLGIKNSTQIDKVTRQSCTQVVAIAASNLYKPGSMDSIQLRNAIEGRIVLVGYGLTGSSDTVVSPVNGTIAGVFYHAVALDNLIQFGGQYWHVPAEIDGYSFNVADIFEVIVQALVLFLVIVYRYEYIENRNTEIIPNNIKSDLWNGIKPVMLVFSVMLISILISHYVLNLGLVNWYALPMILIIDLPIFLFFVMTALKKQTINIANRLMDFAPLQFFIRITLIVITFLKTLYGESNDKTSK